MDKNTNTENQNTGQENASSSTRPLSIEAARTPSDANRIEVLPNQPRQPGNLQGLLRFAMEAAKTEDAPHEPYVQPVNENKRRFFNQALLSMSVNVIEELQRDIKLLQNVVDLREEDDPSEYEAALDRIADRADNMDIANDFYKIGGFSIFKYCLNSSHSGIRWRCANVIAELTQNNPVCQQKIFESRVLPILLSMVDSDISEIARIKALYAVSCIARGPRIALMYLDLEDGFSVLMRALQSPIEKLQIKSAFLLSSLFNKDKKNNLKLNLINKGLVEQTAGLLAMGTLLPEAREHLLNVLDGLTKNNCLAGLKECQRPELCLKQTLERHLKESKEEDSPEIEEICIELLDRIFANQVVEQDR